VTLASARRALPVALTGALGVACAHKVAAPVVAPTARTLVVLLPDSDTAVTGRAGVSNSAGSVDLAAPRDSAVAIPAHTPGPVITMSEEEVQRVFGAALAALPPAARHFTLYFLFESNELTDESRALVPEILAVVRQRSLPEVMVVGHTDTMGAPKANIELGLNRATTVRALLVQAGLDESTVEVISHGETDLLVKTPDETPEPRNRRVEISVR
jgi:outer membrane protein OmpA-like peptidoglycan-associated protein